MNLVGVEVGLIALVPSEGVSLEDAPFARLEPAGVTGGRAETFTHIVFPIIITNHTPKTEVMVTGITPSKSKTRNPSTGSDFSQLLSIDALILDSETQTSIAQGIRCFAGWKSLENVICAAACGLVTSRETEERRCKRWRLGSAQNWGH